MTVARKEYPFNLWEFPNTNEWRNAEVVFLLSSWWLVAELLESSGDIRKPPLRLSKEEEHVLVRLLHFVWFERNTLNGKMSLTDEETYLFSFEDEAVILLQKSQMDRIKQIVGRYYSRHKELGVDWHDLLDAGKFGFLKAIIGFNPFLGTSLITYSTFKILRAVQLTGDKKIRTLKKENLILEDVQGEDFEDTRYRELLDDYRNEFRQLILNSHLRERDKEILVMYYCNDGKVTDEDIGKRYSVTRVRGFQLRRDAIKRLKISSIPSQAYEILKFIIGE